jgi:20S proteasome subunit beta 2
MNQKENKISGQFDFSNCLRNEVLKKKGFKMPGFLKTGTTIVGVTFKVL